MSIDTIIQCSDMNASLKFYTKVLDFEVFRSVDPDSYMAVFLKRDQIYFYISQHNGNSLFKNVIYIKVNSIDEVYNKFVNNGLSIQSVAGSRKESTEQHSTLKGFCVLDPDGNKITFGPEI